MVTIFIAAVMVVIGVILFAAHPPTAVPVRIRTQLRGRR